MRQRRKKNWKNRHQAVAITVLIVALAGGACSFGAQASGNQSTVGKINGRSLASAAQIPTLSEMAGGWLDMKNIANPPDVNNFHDMLSIRRDLTSYAFYPDDQDRSNNWWLSRNRMGDPPVRLTVNGKQYSADECRWYPYRVLRRNQDCDGLAVQTDTRLVNQSRGVLERIDVSNPSNKAIETTLALQVTGVLRPNGVSILNTRQRPGHATIVAVVQKPDITTNQAGVVTWSWRVQIPPHGQHIISFVAGDGKVSEISCVRRHVASWSSHFAAQFRNFKQVWQQRWSDAFTPGNDYFSGSLPVLVSPSAEMKRNYYMGILTMLELLRTQFPLFPRSFITSGERSPGQQYYWDASMGAAVWALLEPVGMKVTLRRWLVQNPRGGQIFSLYSVHGWDATNYASISGYAFDADSIFRAADEYLHLTGDRAFLNQRLENGRTVAQNIYALATNWETLPKGPFGLADCGSNRNLLECDPDYIGCVASVNAQDVWMMRQDAQWEAILGNPARAIKLRRKADKLQRAVMHLYNPHSGTWNAAWMNGTIEPVRHCVDFIYVGDALAGDLSSGQKSAMIHFVKSELFTPDWMRAMSLKDPAAPFTTRPDHSSLGSYDGWIPLTVGSLWRLGARKTAYDFYCRTSAVTNEGPFAQAHDFYAPNPAAYYAPVHIALREGCMKECICGSAFANVVIRTFFGFNPTVDGKTLVPDSRAPRPFDGKLLNVRYHGHFYDLTAGLGGVHIEPSPASH